jgi:hypothetical protein
MVIEDGPPYTQQMDTAFRNAHGFGYKELRNDERLRMKVEMRRDKEHQIGNMITAKFTKSYR